MPAGGDTRGARGQGPATLESRPMLRLAGFFVLVWVVMSLLRGAGILGHGLFSFWIVAIALSLLLSHAALLLARRRRLSARLRELGNVESPHNQGKLGALLLGSGRARQAVPHLARAAAGEPEVTDWHYRLGLALLESGRASQAVPPLERAVGLDPEHAYGAAQLALSRARLASGDAAGALAAVDAFDRNHGPNPESAYRRGVAQKRLGQRAEAAASLRQVGELAARAARFQRSAHRTWVLRALLARLA